MIEPRRPGDAARAVASAELITKELGWTASRGVREMVESAWEGWCLRHPEARRELICERLTCRSDLRAVSAGQAHMTTVFSAVLPDTPHP